MKPDSYLKQRSRLCVCLSLLFCLLDPAQAECVKFLIMGDTQKIMDAKNKKQHEFLETMEKLVKDPVTRDADFVLQVGDTDEGSVTCRYYSPLYEEYGDDPSSALYGSDKNPMNYAPEKGPFNHPWTWTGFDFSR